MSGQNPESSDSRQLGSLAREAEQLRLKQSQAPESALLPAVVQPAEQASATAVETVKTAVGRTPAKASRRSLPMFPLGPGFVVILLLVAICGDFVGSVRTNTLGAIVDMVGLNSSPSVYVLSHVDRIKAATRGDAAGMIREYGALATELKNKFGASDQLTSFVQLNLAYGLIGTGDESSARKIWQDQIQYLDHPKVGAPSGFTALLATLAEYYASIGQDNVAARQFYLAAVRFYTFAPPPNTLSNIEQDLASVDLQLGNVAEANQYLKKALALTLSCGNTNYNLYRLREIVRTDIDLKRYADAIPYAEKAAKMAEIVEGKWAAISDGDTLRSLKNSAEKTKLDQQPGTPASN